MKTLGYIVGIFLIVLLSGCGKTNKAASVEKITVRVEKPSLFRFQNKVTTQGVIEAVDHAVLSAQVPGKLEELKVKEGDHVRRGEPLFRSDRENLRNRCLLAEEALKMAKERLRCREADLALAKVNFDKARLDYVRSRTLYKAKAVSQNAHETAELKYNADQLTIRQAETAIATAKAEISFAEVTLKIARKHLEDSVIHAPYDGVITAKLHQENEFCNAGTPVLKIERPGWKRITAAVSAVHYPAFSVGKTQAVLSFRGKELCRVPVTILAPAVDPVSRTFEVKADLPGKLHLPSGMLCDTAFIFGERKSFSVPEDAVLYRQNGKFAVFVMENGTAREVPVVPGLSQNGRTEILQGKTLQDRQVIVSGQYFLNDGTPVVEAKE